MSLMKEEPSFEPSGEDTEARKGWPIGWLTFLALGWMLYELTAQPAIGVMAVCVKFGWEDFRTAFWLRRIDPWYRRGKACFWLYTASGLWRTALASLAMAVPFAICWILAGPANNAPQTVVAFSVSCLTMLASFVLCALATINSTRLASRGGLRLWLGRSVHRARRNNDWPPSLYAHEQSNRLGVLVLTGLLLFAVPVLLFSIFVIISHLDQFRTTPLVIIILVMIGVIRGAYSYWSFVLRKVKASSPSDCWNPHEHP